jgi:8-amino-7-oxononanoate synthase
MFNVTPVDGPYLFIDGKRKLSFASYDFLGLAQHPEVRKRAVKDALRFGVGTLPLFLQSEPQREIEEKLARFFARDRAALFPSGGAALQALLLGFSGKVQLFSDTKLPLCAGVEGALFRELDELEALLQLGATAPRLIMAKSHLHDLAHLTRLAETYEARLCLDDSDTFGIFGKKGCGLGKGSKADLLIGSFEKGGGVPLAYLAAQGHFLDGVRSAPISPPLLGAIDAAMGLIPEMDGERRKLSTHVDWLYAKLSLPLGEGSPVLPVVNIPIETEEEENRCIEVFASEAICIGRPGLRSLSIALTALHTPDDLDGLSQALEKLVAARLAPLMQSFTPTPAR